MMTTRVKISLPGASPISLALGVSLLLLAGCAPQPELRYVNIVSVTEQGDTFAPLDEKDEKEVAGRKKQLDHVATLLRDHFGTPERPRWLERNHQTTGDKSPAVERVPREELLRGAEVYRQNCLACHGVSGDGDGPAATHLMPKPRDYRQGVFKFISGDRGSKPQREDLLRIVQRGAKGTSMPSFRWLPADDLRAVVSYVMLLSNRGEVEREMLIHLRDELDAEDEVEVAAFDAAQAKIYKRWEDAASKQVSPLTPEVPFTAESIAQGRAAFLTKGCSKCHGEDGRGRTQDNVGVDTWGNKTNAADLTSGMLHGGRRPIDLYRRVYAGINGTPMPGFKDALQAEPDTIWHLVHFVLHVAGRSPVKSDAPLPAVPAVDAALPADDSKSSS